jgi:outer membrane biosynthesis protein TonB
MASSRGVWAAARAAVLLLMMSATVLAQPRPGQPYDKERARALYDEGLRHYNVAEYDQAIEAFKGSYLVSGDPKLLFNVAQAYRLKGDCEQAVRFYKNFQREKPDADNATEVQLNIAKCESTPAPERNAATVPDKPPVAPVPDRPTPPVAPPPAATPPPPARAAAPPPVVVPPAPEIAPAGKLRPSLAVPESRAVRRAPPRNHGDAKRATGLALAGVGAGLVGGGLYFGLKASKQASTTESFTGDWGPAQQTAERNAQRDGRVGLILTGLGVAGLLGGGTLYWLGVTERDEGSSLALSPNRGGATVVWTCKL